MENKKISKEELEKLQEQQQQYTKMLYDLGIIELSKNNLELQLNELFKEKEILLNNIKELNDKADIYQKELATKYGEVDINLNNGEITPVLK